MAGLDEISRVIGGIETDVRYIRERVDHTHDCLHGNGGLASRIGALERGQAFEKGKAAGYGAIGGSAITLAWKLVASKLGLG